MKNIHRTGIGIALLLTLAHLRLNAAIAVAAPPRSLPGGTVKVTWTGAPSGSSVNDWIGLYKAGDPNSAFLARQNTGGLARGRMFFQAPATPGFYEFRYFLNGTFTEPSPVAHVTIPVGASVVVRPSVVKPLSTVNVKWSGAVTGGASDAVALFKVGDPVTSAILKLPTAGAANGSATLAAPSAKGRYEVRYLSGGLSEPLPSVHSNMLLVSGVQNPNIWNQSDPGGGGAFFDVGAGKDGVIFVASDVSGLYGGQWSLPNGASPTANWTIFGALDSNGNLNPTGLQQTNLSAVGFANNSNNGTNILFVGSLGGLYKSTYTTFSNALAFTHVPLPTPTPSDPYPTAITCADALNCYVAAHWSVAGTPGSLSAYGRVYHTTDGGTTWSLLPAVSSTDFRIQKLIVDGNQVYAITGPDALTGAGPSIVIWQYDPSSGWTNLASRPACNQGDSPP